MKNYTRSTIALKKLNGLIPPKGTNSNREFALTFQANVMSLGFILTNDLFEAICTLSKTDCENLHAVVTQTLREMKGAHVEHKPMYPNFPQQVIEASAAELFFNAIIHYWSYGQWKPSYENLPRTFAFEETKFQPIKLATEEEFQQILPTILLSADSISEEDKEIVRAIIKNEKSNAVIPSTIPFKENMCLVVGILFEVGLIDSAKQLLQTATDVLRVATYLSGGDISLAENTKFKSFPRNIRRAFVSVLENVGREEDYLRHKNKWIRLFHGLHVGEFKYNRVRKAAYKIRSNVKIETFNGRVEQHINDGNVVEACNLLIQRPGDFTRRIDHLLRISQPNEQSMVIDEFLKVANQVPARNLLQLVGHLLGRNERETRVVFPKGVAQRARSIRGKLPHLDQDVIDSLGVGISSILIDRFSEFGSLGNVWIDPNLDFCPLPTQQRSASEGLWSVARGTQLPIGDKNFLRLFVYWVGRDVDLSATFHNEDFNEVAQISWTQLRNGSLRAWHSGDIVSAPTGASEFIDVDIDGAIDTGVRYICMNVFSFSNVPFDQMDECFVGWMTRDEPQSNEIYEPKTVEQRIDLTSKSRNAVPVIFDLVERKVIWVDLTTITRSGPFGNSVESNAATIKEIVESMTDLSNKVSLYALATLHTAARGTRVESEEDADTVFSVERKEGAITPFDINRINSEFVV